MSSLLLPTKRLALAPAIGEAAQAETTTAEAEADLWIGRVLRAAAAVEAEGSAEEDEIAPLGPPSPSLLLLHREKRLPSPDDAEEALLLLLWLLSCLQQRVCVPFNISDQFNGIAFNVIDGATSR